MGRGYRPTIREQFTPGRGDPEFTGEYLATHGEPTRPSVESLIADKAHLESQFIEARERGDRLLASLEQTVAALEYWFPRHGDPGGVNSLMMRNARALIAAEAPICGLTCCCCGESCRGRQWHNRDAGFGLCSGCAVWLRSRGTSDDEMRELYGIDGLHYNVSEAA